MTITENQRRTLDLMAESAGWSWADVEALARDMYDDCVAGLTWDQANAVMTELALTEFGAGPRVVYCAQCGDLPWCADPKNPSCFVRATMEELRHASA